MCVSTVKSRGGTSSDWAAPGWRRGVPLGCAGADGLGRGDARRKAPGEHGPDRPGKGHSPRVADPLYHCPLGGIAPGVAAGNYDLCCRTIDRNGIAQPMPRPLLRTGANSIHRAAMAVKG